MSTTPTLFSISPSGSAGKLSVTQVWQQAGDAPLPADCGHICPIKANGSTYLVCARDSGDTIAVRIDETEPYLEQVESSLEIGGPWDALEPFVLGNAPYLLAYASEKGKFLVYPIGPRLKSSTPYSFSRKRPPGVTTGFDMVALVVVLGAVYIVAYAYGTGKVCVYSLAVTSTNPPSLPGTPALLAKPVWDHEWAAKWTRFAFFALGGEVFFFKINDGQLNVNIDHLLDDPALGTVEVGSQLQNQLPDALNIDVVRAFCLGGSPYLLSYKANGDTNLYRVRVDCQGWTQVASLSTVTRAAQVVPYAIGDRTFALFY